MPPGRQPLHQEKLSKPDRACRRLQWKPRVQSLLTTDAQPRTSCLPRAQRSRHVEGGRIKKIKRLPPLFRHPQRFQYVGSRARRLAGSYGTTCHLLNGDVMIKSALFVSVLLGVAPVVAEARPKINFQHATGVQIGKTSFSHAGGAAIDLKGGSINAAGATSTRLDLGKVKVGNDMGLGLSLPMFK
jgi:hypothetical protein